MNYKYIMNKKIYLLIVLALAVHVSFGQNLTPEGKDSLKLIITRFGQLLDLSAATGAKQTSVRPIERNAANEFANLFKAHTLDTVRIEKDSLIIVSFLDPNIRLFECYTNTRDADISALKKKVDTCLNEKKTLKDFPKLSVDQYIDTVFKYYTQTVSDINENDIQINYEAVRHIHKKRYQVLAEAPLKEFRGNVNVNYSTELGLREYRYKAPDLTKGDQLPLQLRFFISYDVYKGRGGKGETNFKIDSVTLVKVIPDSTIVDYTKARGYLEPYIGYGLSFFNLNTEDPRFNDLTKDNNTMLNVGINGSFYFNNRKFSQWDVGFTTGVGYKSYRTNFSLDSYTDSLLITDDYTAEQLGGEYDLYVDASALEQQNRISVLEVPLLFSVNYNFTQKRTLGIYGRIGGLFNLVLANEHEMKDGSLTYTGHIERLINGTYTDFYFDSNIPEYGFSTYEASVDETNKLTLNDYFISGRLNLGIYGMNKIQTIGWHLGTFFDVGLTNMLGSDHQPTSSLSRGQGNVNSFYGITDKLNISNWGIEFGISIQLFKEKIIYLKTN